MVAGNAAVQSRMRRSGIGTVSPAMGLAAMERILSSPSAPAQVCCERSMICHVKPGRSESERDKLADLAHV